MDREYLRLQCLKLALSKEDMSLHFLSITFETAKQLEAFVLEVTKTEEINLAPPSFMSFPSGPQGITVQCNLCEAKNTWLVESEPDIQEWAKAHSLEVHGVPFNAR